MTPHIEASDCCYMYLSQYHKRCTIKPFVKSKRAKRVPPWKGAQALQKQTVTVNVMYRKRCTIKPFVKSKRAKRLPQWKGAQALQKQTVTVNVMCRKRCTTTPPDKRKRACERQRGWAHRLCAGVPKRSRTSGLLLRRQSLYPTELLGHITSYILPHISPHCKP